MAGTIRTDAMMNLRVAGSTPRPYARAFFARRERQQNEALQLLFGSHGSLPMIDLGLDELSGADSHDLISIRIRAQRLREEEAA